MKYNLLGQKFGRLTVIKSMGANNHSEHIWKCKCECGKEIAVNAYALVSGHTKSCGCLSSDTSRLLNTKHGESHSRLSRIYQNMIHRCNNNKNDNFKYYGGKGIKVCDEWIGNNGFLNFISWAKENGYQSNLTIDRIDSNGDYSPNNCRWATMKQQQNNRSSNVRYEYNGMIKTKSEWSDYFNVKYSTFQTMIKKYGFDQTVERLLTNG